MGKTHEEQIEFAISQDPELKMLQTSILIKTLDLGIIKDETKFRDSATDPLILEKPLFDGSQRLCVDFSQMPYLDSTDSVNINFSKLDDPEFKLWKNGPEVLLGDYSKMAKRDLSSDNQIVIKKAPQKRHIKKVLDSNHLKKKQENIPKISRLKQR